MHCECTANALRLALPPPMVMRVTPVRSGQTCPSLPFPPPSPRFWKTFWQHFWSFFNCILPWWVEAELKCVHFIEMLWNRRKMCNFRIVFEVALRTARNRRALGRGSSTHQRPAEVGGDRTWNDRAGEKSTCVCRKWDKTRIWISLPPSDISPIFSYAPLRVPPSVWGPVWVYPTGVRR